MADRELYLNFWARNLFHANFRVIETPVKGINVFPFSVMKHKTKDLPLAIENSTSYWYTYDASKVGGIVVTTFMTVFKIAFSPGGLQWANDPKGAVELLESSWDSLYHPVQYYTWTFLNPTLFTNPTYCKNENGIYSLRDGLLDVGFITMGAVVARYALVPFVRAIQAGVNYVFSKRRRKRNTFNHEKTHHLIGQSTRNTNKQLDNNRIRLRILANMITKPSERTTTNLLRVS